MEIQEITIPKCVGIVQNNPVSLFEEYLSLGQWLSEDQSLAIYKYLSKTSVAKYVSDSKALRKNSTLEAHIANGSIRYTLTSNVLEYQVRKKDEKEWSNCIRTLKLLPFGIFNNRRMANFFAQAELDVIQNYPLPGKNEENEHSYTINRYPYYTWNYFADGHGKIVGLFKKLTHNDDPLLARLLAS